MKASMSRAENVCLMPTVWISKVKETTPETIKSGAELMRPTPQPGKFIPWNKSSTPPRSNHSLSPSCISPDPAWLWM